MEKYTKDMIPDFKEDIAYYVKDMKRILKNAPKENKINWLSYHKFFELDRKVERLHTLCILLELNLDVEVWGQKNFGEVLINKTYKFNLVKKYFESQYNVKNGPIKEKMLKNYIMDAIEDTKHPLDRQPL